MQCTSSQRFIEHIQLDSVPMFKASRCFVKNSKATSTLVRKVSIDPSTSQGLKWVLTLLNGSVPIWPLKVCHQLTANLHQSLACAQHAVCVKLQHVRIKQSNNLSVMIHDDSMRNDIMYMTRSPPGLAFCNDNRCYVVLLSLEPIFPRSIRNMRLLDLSG